MRAARLIIRIRCFGGGWPVLLLRSSRVMADIFVTVCVAYVAIIVIGLAAILIGSAAQWRWVRNFYFRAAHLAMILLVCAEALVGTTCPLTRLENTLRLRGGETGYAHDFIGYWLDWLIFYDAPSWVFTARWPAFLIQMRNTDTVAKLQADPTSR